MAYNCAGFKGFAIGGVVKQNAILLFQFCKISRECIGVHVVRHEISTIFERIKR